MFDREHVRAEELLRLLGVAATEERYRAALDAVGYRGVSVGGDADLVALSERNALLDRLALLSLRADGVCEPTAEEYLVAVADAKRRCGIDKREN
jgi:hypothetical protein